MLKILLAVIVTLAVVMLQVSTFSTPAHADTAVAAKAKKKAKKKKKTKKLPAATTCNKAIGNMNIRMRDRAARLYSLRRAKTSKRIKKFRKLYRQETTRYKKARATVMIRCAGSNQTSALDAECSITITKLEKLFSLQMTRKLRLVSIRGNSKKAKKKRRVMRSRMKKTTAQIKTQTTTILKACDKTGTTPGGADQGNGQGGDNSGNTGPVDTTAPGAPSVTVVGGSPTNSDAIAVVVETTEPGGTVECRLDGGEWEPAWWDFTLPSELVAADGAYQLDCRQTDDSGNTGEAGSAEFVVDRTAPAAPTIVGPDGPVTEGDDITIGVEAPAGETGGRLECQINGGEWIVVNSPWSPVLERGVNTISCRYVDEAGNTGDTETITVEVVKPAPGNGPDVTVDPGENGDGPTVDVDPPAGETGPGTTECRLLGNGVDSGWFVVNESPFTLPALKNGHYTITCRYTDEDGNVSDETSVDFDVDNPVPGAPAIDITDADGNPVADGDVTNSSTLDVDVTVDDGNTLQCRESGGEWNVWNGQSQITLGDGVWTLECRQVDDLGNEGETSSTTVTVDTQAPAAPTVIVPDGPVTEGSDIEIEIIAPDGETGGHLECQIDGGEWVIVSSPWSPVLDRGVHTISCRYVDEAGNAGDTDSGVIEVVKTPPTGGPDVSVDPGENGEGPTVTVDPPAGETGPGTTECRVVGNGFDSGWVVVNESPFTLPALKNGHYTITCRYIDEDGNVSDETSVDFDVDNPAPGTPVVTGPANGITNNTTPTINVSGVGQGNTLECSLDDGPAQPVPAEFDVPVALDDGTHTVSCTQTDENGNTSAPGSVTFTVDTVAPGLTLNDGTVGSDGSYGFTFDTEDGATVQCKVGNGQYTTVTSPASTGPQGNGEHTLSCIATDAAGNSSAPATKTFSVFKGPVTVSTNGGSKWGLACTPSGLLNWVFGCPIDNLTITIPANPNGVTGDYLVDLQGTIKNLSSSLGIVSTYTMYITVDGAKVASDSATSWIELGYLFSANLSATKNNLTLSASQPHTIQLSLKSSSLLNVLPSIGKSSLTATIKQ